MKCKTSPLLPQGQYRCPRCNGEWFLSMGAPSCFPPVAPGHERKLAEVTAQVQKTIDEDREVFNGDAVDQSYEENKDKNLRGHSKFYAS